MTAPIQYPNISLEEVETFRARTERLSRFFSTALESHFATLYPLLAPKRIFGKYLGSRDSAAWADDNWKSLGESYRLVCKSPFDIRSDFNEEAGAAMETEIALHPWEYPYSAGGRDITVVSPVRWAVTYRSDYALADIRAQIAGRSSELRPAAVRAFLVNALAFQLALKCNPGVLAILRGLRLEVKTEQVPGLGQLSMATIAAPVAAFRPPDSLIASVVRLSGVSRFHELVDSASAGLIEDPVRREILRLVEDNGPEASPRTE